MLVTCSCGKSVRVNDKFARKLIRCPGCQNPVRVPASEPSGVKSPNTSRIQQPDIVPDDVTIPPVNPNVESVTIPPASPSKVTDTLPPANQPDDTKTIPPSQSSLDEVEAIAAEVPGYEILGELGRGGMGVVYKARHIQLVLKQASCCLR